MSNNKYFGMTETALSNAQIALLSTIPATAIPYLSSINQSLFNGASPTFSSINAPTINSTTLFASNVKTSSTSGHYFMRNTTDLKRFTLGLTNAETGVGNKGADFLIERYSDIEGTLGWPIKINRDTGYVGIGLTNTATNALAPLDVNGVVKSAGLALTGLSTLSYPYTTYKGLYIDPITNAVISGDVEHLNLASVMNNHTVEFFGDSITAGVGLTNPTTERWSALLTASYTSCTESNQGIGGNQIQDLTKSGTKSIYSAHSDASTVFIGIGVNDICKTENTDPVIDELLSAYESVALFCCLPSSSRKWIQDPSTVLTGTWLNLTVGYGMYTTTVGSSFTQTVSGRFVGFNMINIANVSNANGRSISLDVVVDGVTLATDEKFWTNVSLATANGTTWTPQDFIYDTGATGNHTITVTYKAISSVASVNMMYVFGFDVNHLNTNTVFSVGVENVNWMTVTRGSANYAAGTDARRNNWNAGLKSICSKFRKLYGLHMYFADIERNTTYGYTQADNIHPNTRGHVYIKDKVKFAIDNATVF